MLSQVDLLLPYSQKLLLVTRAENAMERSILKHFDFISCPKNRNGMGALHRRNRAKTMIDNFIVNTSP